jgi:transposase
MFDSHEESERIEMSQRERDRLRVLYGVSRKERSQKEAARLLGVTVRQVRRLVRRLEHQGDQGLVHGLRGRASNHRLPAELRQKVVTEYQRSYGGFGPTLASEKLMQQGLEVGADTLRLWLLAEGLWQRQRRRDEHRQRRPRRSCFGELVQMDTSIHDWLEGRGESMVLIAMIDDATSRIEAGFYAGETLLSHLELLKRWLQKHGRPWRLYTDRDSIFEAQSHGRVDYSGQTQFGRALEELGIGRVTAYSPQAKGRVERFFGLAQDRWVKELRLTDVRTMAQANVVLRKQLVPEYNRRFTVPAADARDAHRELGGAHHLTAILSVQSQRVVDNDYTVRFRNHCLQIAPPALPGLRRGKVILEERLDGTLAMRFGTHYLSYREIPPRVRARTWDATLGGSAPQTPRSLTPVRPTPVPQKRSPRRATVEARATKPKRKKPNRPAADHPWRKPALRK